MTDLHNYKREMVLLFLPFRNEMLDLLDCNKFLQLYDEHESGLLQKRKEYDCEFNLEQTVEEYLRMCGANADEEQEAATDKHNECVRTITMEPNDDDIQNLPTHTLTAVVKQRSNVMSKQAYCEMVRATNPEQRALVLHVIHSIHSFDGARKPLQIFFTGPAGSGKTFTLRVLMETYNRFSQAHNAQNNAYVACASTGKAAVAIGGTTVHSAFRLTMSRRNNAKLSFEILQLYRNAFAHVQAIIVDEVSMIGANILDSIHARLQDIRGEYDDAFGGIDIILVGDFRQLPPVNARFIWKPPANSMHGAVLWQSLEFYPLVRVMRQSDEQFSTVLTKIGNGTRLSDEETQLIESRFRTADWCKQNVPNAIRLFHRNLDVDQYNNDILRETDGLDCLAEDVFSGYRSDEQLASARNKLHKMSVVEAGGLPYLLRLTVGMPYMITTNVEVEDGIVNARSVNICVIPLHPQMLIVHKSIFSAQKSDGGINLSGGWPRMAPAPTSMIESSC
nr:ATP-dependent DNA helicase pfh1-like [Aedes albopictus]